MANDERSRLGLFPISQPYGSMRVGYYRANTALAIGRYHPVVVNNSGQVQLAAPGDNNRITGSAIGFLDLNKASLPSGMTTLSQAAMLPASTDAWVQVTNDPDQLYMLEEDTGGSALTNADVGSTCAFTYLGSGTNNTTTGISNVVLDRSDVAADSGGSLQLVAVADWVNQDGTFNAAGNFGKWIVKIAHHELGPVSLNPGI